MSWVTLNLMGIFAVMIIILGAVIDQLIRVVNRADSEFMREMSDEALRASRVKAKLNDS